MEKLELMHDTEAMVYCSDNDIVSRCIRRMHYKGEKISWSQCDEQATLYIKEVKESGVRSQENTTEISYRYKGEEGTYVIPFIDEASIENSVTCAAVALHLGVTPTQLAERMPNLEDGGEVHGEAGTDARHGGDGLLFR